MSSSMTDSRELTFAQVAELKKFRVGQGYEPIIYQDVADGLVRMGMIERTVSGNYALTTIGQAIARMEKAGS
jgi:hypothetical protein